MRAWAERPSTGFHWGRYCSSGKPGFVLKAQKKQQKQPQARTFSNPTTGTDGPVFNSLFTAHNCFTLAYAGWRKNAVWHVRWAIHLWSRCAGGAGAQGTHPNVQTFQAGWEWPVEVGTRGQFISSFIHFLALMYSPYIEAWDTAHCWEKN